MKIQILQIAKTKDSSIATLEAEYEKRIRPFASMETITLSASKKDERHQAQAEEKESFLAKLDDESYIIVLDERGKELTSEAFADLLLKQRDFGPGKIQLLIGGSHGLHPDLIQSAHYHLSLSKMTFTHEMVRVFLKEQLYRAFTILAGKKYHK